ncbi:MAG: hypothetical protein KDE14_00615 [Rhodobacteraceae bacterium]|nr:hypothetical protein [Paracoccaceae bacterium]
MNKFNLQLAGGALLASTALLSGTVAVHAQATIKAAAVPKTVPATLIAAPLAAEVLTGTTTAAVLGPQAITVDSSAKLVEKTVVVLNISGASFDTTSSPTVSIFAQSVGGSLIAAASAGGASIANATITVFSDRVRITDVSASSWSAMTVSGLQYVNALALATAGHSITLSGVISNNAETATLETISAKAVVTSIAGAKPQVGTGASITVSNTANPQFSTVTQTGFGTLSARLSTVSLTNTTTTHTGSDLTTPITNTALVSTLEVKLTHSVLTDPAVSTVVLNSAAVATTRTTAQFNTGTVTWTVASTGLGVAQDLKVNFNGTTAISGWSAGTTTVTPVTLAANGSKLPAAVSGTAVALTRGGLNTTVNVFQPSTNAFASFLRVTNTGSTAGTVTVTVRQSSTGTTLGTYTSASISPGASIQISATDLETGAQITNPTQYDLNIAGPISGFVQHIGFKSDSGVVTDLSSFRNTSI